MVAGFMDLIQAERLQILIFRGLARRRLRAREGTRDIPVIMLTARGEEADVVVGLEVGADDYVVKPFSPRELVARVRAVIRRRTPRTSAEPEQIELGEFVLDAARHEVRVKGRLVPALTATEFRLLRALAGQPGRVFTRDQLLEVITRGEALILERNVDAHVRAVRKKLGAAGELVVTVRGVGYKVRD